MYPPIPTAAWWVLAFASCAALVAAFLPLASGPAQRARVWLMPTVMTVVAVAFTLVRGHDLDAVLSLFVAASMGLALSTVGNRKVLKKINRDKVLYGELTDPMERPFPMRVVYQAIGAIVLMFVVTGWLRGVNMVAGLVP